MGSARGAADQARKAQLLAQQCLGEEAYATASLAHKVARRKSKMKGPKEGRRVDIYRCPQCGHWHHATARRSAWNGRRRGEVAHA